DIRGHVVRQVWIEQASDIAREYYLSITFDRGAKKPLFMFTTQGGVEIEQVAEESPDALVRLHVDPLEGFQPWQARRLVYDGGITEPGEQKQLVSIIGNLYRCFVETDALLTQINPLIVTPDGEVEALGNGAGLAMSTVDGVAHVGGRPANFCDLGGGGDAQGVVDALEVITGDPQVKSIFFNIFGGITRGDEVARGILQALDQLDMSGYPIVVRLDGTNSE